jgi:hypothetical protein
MPRKPRLGGKARAAYLSGMDSATGGPQRDLRLDFFRGLALFLIFIDHIPDNTLSYFTLPSIGFSDAAEVFIFISGYTAALVYGSSMLKRGGLFAAAQVLRRVWQLYVAHIFLFVIFTAEVSYLVLKFNNPMYHDELGVGDFLSEPHVAIIQALLLRFQPTFLDILPLYIVLLLIFPLVLFALRRHTLLALLPALAIYLFVQATALTVPGYPQDHVWYFNPLAWQLLFVLGGALGFARAAKRDLLPFWPWLVRASLTVFAVAFVIRLTWTIHGIWDPFPGLLLKELWPVNKNNLAPIRLLHFLALAVIVVQLVPEKAAWLRSAFARPVILCGRHSLHIFCLGILLSVLGHLFLNEVYPGLAAQALVNFSGIAVMIAAAALMSWYKQIDQEEPRRVPPPLPGGPAAERPA